jgi:hypothetical protein
MSPPSSDCTAATLPAAGCGGAADQAAEAPPNRTLPATKPVMIFFSMQYPQQQAFDFIPLISPLVKIIALRDTSFRRFQATHRRSI